MENYTCPVCGLKIAETSKGIAIDGKKYHNKCIISLKCENCNNEVGYLARGEISGRYAKVYCSNCATKF